MFSALYIPTWQETMLQELNIDVTKSWADRVEEEEAMNKPIVVINLDDSAGWTTAGHTKRNRSRLSDTSSDKSTSSNGSNVSLGKIVHHQSWKGAKGDWGLIHPNAPILGNKKEFVLFRGATPPRGSIVAFEYTISDAGVLAQITNIVR